MALLNRKHNIGGSRSLGPHSGGEVERARRLPIQIRNAILVVLSLVLVVYGSWNLVAPAVPALTNSAASTYTLLQVPVVSSGDSDVSCTNEAMYQHPENFGKCIREAPSPSCDAQQKDNWNEWVGNRYVEYGEQCITPALMKKKGKEWAISGRGSTLKATLPLRNMLEHEIFRQYNIKTFLDCPCGDFLWMQEVNMQDIQYFGADITPIAAQVNNRCFANDHRQFYSLDWSCQIPPPVDLLLVRDVFFHLSTSVVLDIMRHINESGGKYLMTTSFSDFSHRVGPPDDYYSKGVGYRNINLYRPPYNFPEPLIRVEEADEGRHIGLWKLDLVV